MPSRGPPVRHSLQMSTKPVTTRATTATRAGCVRHGVGPGPDTADARPWSNPLLRPLLPLLRGKMEKRYSV